MDESSGPEGAQRPPSLRRLAAIFYGAMLGISLVWAALTGRSLLYASAEAASAGVQPVRDAAAGLLAGGVVVLLTREFTLRTRVGEGLGRALAEVLGPLGWRDCLLLAALSGVAEEAFFRGALQPLVGLVVASLIFGLVHFVPRREFLPWTGFAIAAGFLLGVLFETTGNLLAPVLAHATINAVNLKFLSARYAQDRRPG